MKGKWSLMKTHKTVSPTNIPLGLRPLLISRVNPSPNSNWLTDKVEYPTKAWRHPRAYQFLARRVQLTGTFFRLFKFTHTIQWLILLLRMERTHLNDLKIHSHEFHLVSKIIENTQKSEHLSTVYFVYFVRIFSFFLPRPWGLTFGKSRRDRRSIHTRECLTIYQETRHITLWYISKHSKTWPGRGLIPVPSVEKHKQLLLLSSRNIRSKCIAFRFLLINSLIIHEEGR